MPTPDLKAQMDATISVFGGRSFSTKEFIDELSRSAVATWTTIVNVYGVGGRGSRNVYSSSTYIAQQLEKRARNGQLAKLDYRPAPAGWGNQVIRYWTVDRRAAGGTLYPDEVTPIVEGALQSVSVNRYERDPKARELCIEHHGISCQACEMNFESSYGAHGAGFIHVHHKRPLSVDGASHEVDPKKDLVPLCPNCHAMVHYGLEMLEVAALKQLIARAKAR